MALKDPEKHHRTGEALMMMLMLMLLVMMTMSILTMPMILTILIIVIMIMMIMIIMMMMKKVLMMTTMIVMHSYFSQNLASLAFEQLKSKKAYPPPLYLGVFHQMVRIP